MPEATTRGLEGRAPYQHYLVSHTLSNSAAVTARRMLGHVSTSSCPRSRRASRKCLVHDILQQAFLAHHYGFTGSGFADGVAEPR